MTGNDQSQRRAHDRIMKVYQGDKDVARFAKADLQTLRKHYRFLLDDGHEEDSGWESRMVRAYHDHLYKEYALADLSRANEPSAPIGLRWRTEKEVINGRGHFTCGSLHCKNEADLQSWELPFSYAEQGEAKLALVKVRLCPACSALLPASKRREA